MAAPPSSGLRGAVPSTDPGPLVGAVAAVADAVVHARGCGINESHMMVYCIGGLLTETHEGLLTQALNSECGNRAAAAARPQPGRVKTWQLGGCEADIFAVEAPCGAGGGAGLVAAIGAVAEVVCGTRTVCYSAVHPKEAPAVGGAHR